MSKWLPWSLLAVVAYVFIGYVGYYFGIQHGQQQGVDRYHQMCYTGGIIVDEKTGTAVQCSPLGRIPKEELPNFFPKGVDRL